MAPATRDGRNRKAAKGIAMATAVPIAAALIATGPATADPDLPELPFLGEIVTGSGGSDGPGAVAAPSGSGLGMGTGSSYSGNGDGGANSGSSLGLGPSGAAAGTGSAMGNPGQVAGSGSGADNPGQVVGSGSAVGTLGDAAGTGSALGIPGDAAGTGSALGGLGQAGGSGSAGNPVAGPATGSALGLGPGAADIDGGAYIKTGSSLTGSSGTEAGGKLGRDFGGTPVAGPSTLGEMLGLESGSVLTACAGSAVVGVGAILLGLATGSGFGSGLIGPGFVPGSSGLVGPGSSGAGSVVVGSAVTGSALITCLLLIPVPPTPEPGIPLEIPTPVAPVAAPIAPVPAPEVAPPAPVVVPPPPPPHVYPIAAAPLPDEATNWTALQMMTVIVITIIAAARVKTSRGRD